jgi:hypothetical protein
VEDRCNDIDRQNILAKFPDKSSLTLYRELNFSWGKKLYMLFEKRKTWNSLVTSMDMATQRSKTKR